MASHGGHALHKLPPLHLLQALSALHREGDVVSAARSLSVSQPTLSRQLMQLQDLFPNDRLFEFRGRKKTLTAFAQSLAQSFETRLEGFENLIREARNSTLPVDKSPLLVGARREILLKYFARVNVQNDLTLLTLSSGEIRRRLEKRTLDVAITHVTFSSADYIRKKLFEDRFGLAVPRALRHRPAEAYCSYTVDDSHLRGHGSLVDSPQPKPSFVCADWHLLEERIQSGLGWGFLPSSFVRADAAYEFMEFRDTTLKIFWLYYLKRFSRSRLISHFLRH